MTDEVDAAVARYLADGAERLRRRTDEMTAILLRGVDLPPGGPFPDAFTTPTVRPAAGPAETGSTNRHRRRRPAAKARH